MAMDASKQFAAFAKTLLDPATEAGIYPDYTFQGIRRSGRTRAVAKFLCGLQEPCVIFYVAQSSVALEMLKAEGAVMVAEEIKGTANEALIVLRTPHVQILFSVGNSNATRGMHGGLNLCIMELPRTSVPDLGCPVILI